MKALFNSKPILSFILLTFLITFFFWFLPVVVSLPKDIELGTFLLGGCGPLLAGYVITVSNSGAKFKIGSKSIFSVVFLAASIVLLLRLYFTNNGLDDINGKIPTLKEISVVGYFIIAIALFILGLNASNATNANLKGNYLRTFPFNKIKIKWYLIGFLLLPIFYLASYYLGNLFHQETTDFVIKPEAIWLIGFFSTFFFFGANEEFGWRGFLQKELQMKYNPLVASIMISFFWSFWHLPLHYNGIYSTGGFMDLLPRFIWMIPYTIIFTWLYNKSAYSILGVVILHAMLNNTGKAFGYSEIVISALGLLFCFYCVFDDKMWKKKSYHLVYYSDCDKDH